LLTNGQVLVEGGEITCGNYTPSAELYDPSTGRWTKTGSLIVTRYAFEATALQSGEVLVAGGYAATGAFSPTRNYMTPLPASGPLPAA
jgi:hypothetical protein